MTEAYCLILLSLVMRIRCQMEGYIVGGQPATITQFPHSVYLFASKNLEFSWTCGASIVNQDIILTAAHCVYGPNAKPVKNIDISAGSAIKMRGQKTTAKQCIIHEEYDDDLTINDIALIKIKTRFTFNKKIKRVALMLRPPPTKEAQIAGWGLMDDGNWVPAQQLQYTTYSQMVWTKADCERVAGHLPDNILCAQSKSKKQYVTSGDSGSALVINGYIQIGIVSFKRPEVSKNLIMYTNVSSYITWITNKAKLLQCGY